MRAYSPRQHMYTAQKDIVISLCGRNRCKGASWLYRYVSFLFIFSSSCDHQTKFSGSSKILRFWFSSWCWTNIISLLALLGFPKNHSNSEELLFKITVPNLMLQYLHDDLMWRIYKRALPFSQIFYFNISQTP